MRAIDYLIHTGQLTQTGQYIYEQIHIEGATKDSPAKIIFWGFPEPEMNIKELEAIENSPEFQDYLLNRDKILAEKELSKAMENPAIKAIVEKNEALTKQVNELTKLLQTSKDIVEINTEAAKLEPLPEKMNDMKIITSDG